MKRKYGLALGSGGAKGIVHIGALQALYEEKITFSCVSGTSIGSIIAGMYALGYTAREMIGVIEEMNLNKPKWLLDMKLKRNYIEMKSMLKILIKHLMTYLKSI